MLEKPKGINDDLSVLVMALEALARAPSILVALRWSWLSQFVLGGAETRSPLPSLTWVLSSPRAKPVAACTRVWAALCLHRWAVLEKAATQMLPGDEARE